MDKNGSTYEDRDRSRSHRKRHREERRQQGDDALEDDRDRHRSREPPSEGGRRRERSRSHERERTEKHRDKDRHHRSTRDSSRHGYASGDETSERQSSRKRKDYEGGKEDATKKEERKEVKRERRRFGDRADNDLGYLNGNHEGGKGDDLRADDKSGDIIVVEGKKEEEEDRRHVNQEKIDDSKGTMIAGEGQRVGGGDVPISTKVSTISTTNEKDGVHVTRSDEVPGKFSADKSAVSVAAKSSTLSLDALAKAKKALQMQRELSEKLKKIPLLNKAPVSSPGAKPSGEGDQLAESSGASSSKSLLPGLPPAPNFEAVKRAQELAARMGFRHDPQFAPLINMFPGAVAADIPAPQKPSKAPVLRLDALGREIDEHGNIVSVPKPTNLSTLKVNINKQKKEAFQILKPDLDGDAKSSSHFDDRLGIDKMKLLRPKRMTFQFVEEGRWSRQAEILRFKSQFGEAQAKELKMKQTQLAKAKAEPDINPNLIEVSERVVKQKQKDPIPEIEWWDKPILLTVAYGNDPASKLNVEKINVYVEHPLPIEPLAEPRPPPPQPLKLTKKEQKKLRTQRRLAKEKDRQEMIRQGLIEPPKPKVKMSNLMKVLGAEATQDPTKLEMEIRSAAAERERAHVDRNIARKLTPAERREKKERKLFEDPYTVETVVSVYRVDRLAHPKARFQVDVNAQENRLSGCAVISDSLCVVVVEGGKKSNKRYKNLMLKRIDWAAAAAEEGEDDEADGGGGEGLNRCFLVWQGSVVRPSFNRFLVHQCRTEVAARKVFADAGVEHYWDLALNYSGDAA